MTDTANNVSGSSSELHADLELLDLETRSLLQSVAQLTDAELAEPSGRPGLTRGQVVAHLAREAEDLVRLVVWARTGIRIHEPSSGSDEPADLSSGASSRVEEEAAETDLVASCDLIGDAFRALGLPLVCPVLDTPEGVVPARDLPRLRLQQVVLGHLDLDCGWGLAAAHPLAVADLLSMAVDRLGASAPEPGITMITDEGDRFVVGDGACTVRGPADVLLTWLSRGVDGVPRCDDGLPLPRTV
ncbi:maleylpyruvate isomerase N-terminal domain-containing protein [Austwickia chelonae]|uniref:maleylpyruvate isomerase N-terminal domain-containing protein n=1 Tax=Austwickia chelonae TaxID=100225 RepID=UPI0013C2D220|nr:maleylpyruvate isomerase N-terminal domain-containing protein [Austwickia chelonae]